MPGMQPRRLTAWADRRKDSMTDIHKLAASDLYRRCDPGQFSFTTTDELETVQSVIGQPRAVEALQFGMEIQEEGYNIFALGPPGTGKRSVIDRFFRRRAGEEQVPVDWCYVNNFEETHEPRAIHLPAGMGVEFRRDIEELLSELRTSLSAAFESDEYQTRRQSITQEFQEKQSEAFEELRQRAERQQVALIRTPAGLAVAPVKDGEVLSPEELEDMPEEDQERLRSNVQEIQDDMQEILRQVPRWQREMQDQLKELNHEMAQLAIGGLFDELRGTYAEFDPILQHLDAVEQDVVQNAEHFLEHGEQNPQAESLRQMMAGRQGADRDEALLRR
ncbi:MAG: AAA family ATPase [Armatimonadia bacterium]|nr:AAA family ATPase [Armatimonadia bacterium]